MKDMFAKLDSSLSLGGGGGWSTLDEDEFVEGVFHHFGKKDSAATLGRLLSTSFTPFYPRGSLVVPSGP